MTLVIMKTNKKDRQYSPANKSLAEQEGGRTCCVFSARSRSRDRCCGQARGEWWESKPPAVDVPSSQGFHLAEL